MVELNSTGQKLADAARLRAPLAPPAGFASAGFARAAHFTNTNSRR